MPELNPLLEIQTPIPFDQVRTEHVRPAIRQLVAEAQNRIEAIAAETQPRTFLNTLGALDQASEKLDYASAVVQHLENVVT